MGSASILCEGRYGTGSFGMLLGTPELMVPMKSYPVVSEKMLFEKVVVRQKHLK